MHPGRAHVPHKWGFGMAPPRPETTALRDDAIGLLLEFLGTVSACPSPAP
jgi:hypothetical protein